MRTTTLIVDSLYQMAYLILHPIYEHIHPKVVVLAPEYHASSQARLNEQMKANPATNESWFLSRLLHPHSLSLLLKKHFSFSLVVVIVEMMIGRILFYPFFSPFFFLFSNLSLCPFYWFWVLDNFLLDLGFWLSMKIDGDIKQ